MRKAVRRSVAIALGLALGWYVAGFAPEVGARLTADQARAAGEHAAGHDPHASPAGGHASHDDQAHHTPEAAAMLVPAADQITWYPSIVTAAVALFLGAIILGIPAQALKGPEPADPADHHDAHAGHDAHGGHSHGH